MAYHSEGASEDRTVVSTTKARQAVTGNCCRCLAAFDGLFHGHSVAHQPAGPSVGDRRRRANRI